MPRINICARPFDVRSPASTTPRELVSDAYKYSYSPETTTYPRSSNTRAGASDHSVALPVSDETTPGRMGLPSIPLDAVLNTIEHGIVLLRSDSHPCFSN